MTKGVGYLNKSKEYGSDEISGASWIGSDIFGNGSDIIRYPITILSPGHLSFFGCSNSFNEAHAEADVRVSSI